MTDLRCATTDQLLRALLDSACPRCHRADRIIREWTGPRCMECGWAGDANELEAFRRDDEPTDSNVGWIAFMVCIGVLLGAIAGWLLRAWVRG